MYQWISNSMQWTWEAIHLFHWCFLCSLFWKVSVCIRHTARSKQKRKLIFAYINFLKSYYWLNFTPTFSLSSFSFIKRLFSSSSLSAMRVVSSAYLRWSIFLLAILIPACASSSPAFLMMYSAYKLNKQGDNIQPWRTSFPIWNQSVVPCPVLTVASWPAYRFLRKQVRWSGIPISLRIFQFVVMHTVKGFGIFNKAKVDVFLELVCNH